MIAAWSGKIRVGARIGSEDHLPGSWQLTWRLFWGSGLSLCFQDRLCPLSLRERDLQGRVFSVIREHIGKSWLMGTCVPSHLQVWYVWKTRLSRMLEIEAALLSKNMAHYAKWQVICWLPSASNGGQVAPCLASRLPPDIPGAQLRLVIDDAK